MAPPRRLTAQCTWVLSGRRDGNRRTFCLMGADPVPAKIGGEEGILCPRHQKLARKRVAIYGHL
jgi:hypothetical protein